MPFIGPSGANKTGGLIQLYGNSLFIKRYTQESESPTFRVCRIGDFKAVDTDAHVHVYASGFLVPNESDARSDPSTRSAIRGD
jgi:hypothetical protein